MRDGDVQLARNLAAEIDARQRGGERRVLLQRHVVIAGRLDDALGDERRRPWRRRAARRSHCSEARQPAADDCARSCAYVQQARRRARPRRPPACRAGTRRDPLRDRIPRASLRARPARCDSASTIAGDSARNCTPMRLPISVTFACSAPIGAEVDSGLDRPGLRAVAIAATRAVALDPQVAAPRRDLRAAPASRSASIARQGSGALFEICTVVSRASAPSVCRDSSLSCCVGSSSTANVAGAPGRAVSGPRAVGTGACTAVVGVRRRRPRALRLQRAIATRASAS